MREQRKNSDNYVGRLIELFHVPFKCVGLCLCERSMFNSNNVDIECSNGNNMHID